VGRLLCALQPGRPPDFCSLTPVGSRELNGMYDIKTDPDRPQPRRHVDWYMVGGMICGLLVGGLVGASMGGEVGFILGDIVGGVAGAIVGILVERIWADKMSR
jgi:predicted lipid-binding transport protein (Tim44 family)